MTTVFGKGLRGRRKPEVEEDVAQIADEANLWWTRRDFVQNPVVRTRSTPAATRPAAPAPAAAPVVDPTLHGKAFSEVFTTESLFGRDAPPRPPAAPGGPTTATAPGPAPTAAPTDRAAAPAEPAPQAPADAASRRPRRIPLNHPLFPALLRLGLDAEATWHDVQQSYRRLAKEAHPDRTGDNGEAMADLNAAYTALREARRYGMFGDD